MGERIVGVAAVGLGVLAGALIACRCPEPALAGWAVLASLGFGVAVLALTAPTGPWVGGAVYAGAVVGLGAAMLVGGAAVAAGVLCSIVGVLAGRRGTLGRVFRPLACGAPLYYGALAAGRPAAGVLPWAFVAWLVAVGTLLPGPGEAGNRWIPAAFALAFVPTSLLLPARAYSGYYYLTVLFADLALLIVATRLFVGRLDQLKALVNIAIGVCITALVVGRVL